MIHDRLKCNAVPIQLPIGKEADFKGIVDLVKMQADVITTTSARMYVPKKSPKT